MSGFSESSNNDTPASAYYKQATDRLIGENLNMLGDLS